MNVSVGQTLADSQDRWVRGSHFVWQRKVGMRRDTKPPTCSPDKNALLLVCRVRRDDEWAKEKRRNSRF